MQTDASPPGTLRLRCGALRDADATRQQKGHSLDLPQRWALRLTIEGDLRFASHLDCIRAIERTAARACVPVRFSQGFNPHPILSLACPRPVGIKTRDDLVTLALDEETDGEDLARRMTDCAPRGMRLGRPVMLESKRAPQPRRIGYELALGPDDDPAALASRIAALDARASWPVERVKPPAKRGRPPRRRTVDLRPLVTALSVDPDALRWTAEPAGQMWPRTDELLGLLGLDPRGDSARVVRTRVDYAWPAPTSAAPERKDTHE